MTAATAEMVHVHHHKLKNVNFAIVRISEAVTHEHSSLELGMVLHGTVSVKCEHQNRSVDAGGILLFNSYDRHTLSSDNGATVLFMQLAPGFGMAYFARIASVTFDCTGLDQLSGDAYNSISRNLLNAAQAFFGEPEAFGLECAAWSAGIAAVLLRQIPYQISSESEIMTKKKKIGRQQRISSYIEQHYREKLTLEQLAKAEGISITYMSRIFAELFRKTFQEYVSEFRLSKAMPLLKNPSIYLVDVCMECGFSDTRYLNAVCQKKYGCTAAQLREKLLCDELVPLNETAAAKETPQYSDAEALQILHDYIANKRK